MKFIRTLAGITLLTVASMGAIVSANAQEASQKSNSTKNHLTSQKEESQFSKIKRLVSEEAGNSQKQFWTAYNFSRQDNLTEESRYFLADYFVRTGNPANAERTAEGLKNDFDKYKIAWGLINSGNPRNAVFLLETIALTVDGSNHITPKSKVYLEGVGDVYKGIEYLKQRGYSGNARYLNEYLTEGKKIPRN